MADTPRSRARQILTEWQQADRALVDGFSKSFWGGAAPVEARITLSEVRTNNLSTALANTLALLAGEEPEASGD